ncbi:MAG TPA: ferritin [Geopsychrobacteraceae bacterium]|nr:ferritin [Geopsychrobacteraceae bacterium]
MISEKLQDAINEQITFEISSGLIYKAMAAYLESEDLTGFAKWMQVQFEEELFHADKLATYVNDAGGRVKYLAIEAPCNEYDSPLHAFEASLKHEQIVTSRINNLMAIAKDENDFAAQICLQWFITEQVEEESSFGQIISELKRVKDDGRGLIMLDRELGQRTFTPPAGE